MLEFFCPACGRQQEKEKAITKFPLDLRCPSCNHRWTVTGPQDTSARFGQSDTPEGYKESPDWSGNYAGDQ